MRFKTFLGLLRMAMLSRSFNEFANDAPRVEGYSHDLATTGILFSIWLFSVDHTARKLRELTGLSRAKFCREYALQTRTVENWELRNTEPTKAMLDLLAFAVFSDLHDAPNPNRVDYEDEEDD